MSQEKKKIIFSSYDDINNPFYGGGGAVVISTIAAKLAPVFDITIITANYKGAKNKTENSVTYKRIGPSFFGPRMGQLLFCFLLPFYVKKEKFDLWVESFTPPFSTTCLQLFTKKPVIGLVHMLAGLDMERKYKLPFRAVEEQGLKTYKYFIVLRERTKLLIQNFNTHAKFFIIPNGVDAPKQMSDIKNDDYILFLGRLEFNQKGLDLLIDSYHKIASKVSTKLVIAGSGSPQDEAQIAKKIAEYGLQDRISLVGKVEGQQKEKLLRECRLVALSSRYETFSLLALEAMSYGKPLVTFVIQGLDWIPVGCAIQVKPFDTDEYASALYRILTDKQLQEKMSAAGIKKSKEYTWDTIVERYKQAFLTVLSES